MYNKIKDIEKKYPELGEIQYQGEYVWAYLRMKYYWNSLIPLTSAYRKSKKTNIITKFIIYKNIFYGFKHWFKSYEYMVFSNSNRRVKQNEIYSDISFEKIMEKLDYKKTLYLDTPNPKHLSLDEIPTSHIVSYLPIQIIILLYTKLRIFFTRKRIYFDILSRIKEKENYEINHTEAIITFNIQVKIYTILFKLYKPKGVFVNCAYCNIAIVKAANMLHIKTVEIQHGIIGKSHFAYQMNLNLDKSFFPNILLTYGNYDKYSIVSNQFNPFKKVYALGSYGLILAQNKQIPMELLKIKKEYEYTVSIATQYIVEDEVALFIKELANTHKNIAFLFSLRHFDKVFYDKYSMPSNVYLYKGEYHCYDILRASDIHLTCFSSCALEALFFKKKSVLIDIDSYASKFFGDIQNKNIYIIRETKEFSEILNKDFIPERESFYEDNYLENLDNILNNVIQLKE